jgi:DNA-binding NarL/FixJ family response regulator
MVVRVERGAGGGLVGRRAELGVLERLLVAARSGDAPVVVLVGEPGIGKTRLMWELGVRAGAAGFRVVSGRGSELERDVPFGLVVDALDGPFGALDAGVLRRVGDERLAELGAVLPSLAGAGGRLASALEVERYRSHHAVRFVLGELARARPLVLALDDVHWADPASLELVSHLVLRRVPGLLLALAYRPGQAPARLVSAVAALGSEGGVHSLELGVLSAAEAAMLVGDELNAPLMEALYAESGGNPFYLEQLARAEQRRAEAALPTWTAGAGADAGLGAVVQGAIAQELAGLSPTARRLVEAGAVAGEPFELDVAAEIAGVDQAWALEALDELIGVDLVRATTVPWQIMFRHPIVRRAVYDGVSPASRLVAHRRAAGVLAVRGAAIGARAHHVERSAVTGDETAIGLLTKAGHAAAARAPAAAAHWFEAAVRLLPDSTEAERRLSLLIPLADALAATGRMHDTSAVLSQALALVPADLAGPRGQITALLARTEQDLGHGTRARCLLVEALAHVDAHSADAAALMLELADNHLIMGEWEQATGAAARARTLGRDLDDQALVLVATTFLAWIASLRGAISEASAHIDAVVPACDALVDEQLTPQLLDGLASLAYAEMATDRLAAAATHYERGVRVSRLTGRSFSFLRSQLGLAAARLFQGRLDEARCVAETAVEGSQLLSNDQLLAGAQGVLCWVATLEGDLDGALTAGRAAVEAAQRAPASLYAWVAPVNYGQALIEAGQPGRGRAQMLAAGGPELADLPPASRPIWYVALAVAELAAGQIEAAEATARRAETAAATLGLASRSGDAHYARACVLLARGDPPQAATVAAQAASSYAAAGWRLWEARARLAAGRALALAGDRAAAESELELAYTVLADRGAARLADHAAKELRRLGKRIARWPKHNQRARASPDALSDRERQIAEQVARGCTNRQIASALFVSEKTVERHLTHIFSKLDLTSRAALAATIQRGHTED